MAAAHIKKLDYQKLNGTIFNEEIALHESKTVTFQDVYDNWVKVYKDSVQSSTYDKTVTIFKIHILPKFGHLEVDKISLDYCQSFISELAKDYQSYRKAFNYASLVFDFAEARGLIIKNPMKHVIIPKATVNIESEEELLFKGNYYDKEELIYFLKCAKNHNSKNQFMKYTFFTLLSYSGLRKGEAFALKWKDINFSKKYLSVTKAVSNSKEKKLHLSIPKNKKSRLVSLDDGTLAILKEWQIIQKALLSSLNQEKEMDEQLIFMNSKNELLHPTKAQQWIKDIQKTFNLKEVSPHGLRHSHCTYCFEIGMSPRDVKNRLGHSDINITMNVYDFTDNQARMRAVDKINKDKEK